MSEGLSVYLFHLTFPLHVDFILLKRLLVIGYGVGNAKNGLVKKF